MMIISQDREMINFDNVVSISKIFGGDGKVHIDADALNYNFILGKYTTE